MSPQKGPSKQRKPGNPADPLCNNNRGRSAQQQKGPQPKKTREKIDYKERPRLRRRRKSSPVRTCRTKRGGNNAGGEKGVLDPQNYFASSPTRGRTRSTGGGRSVPTTAISRGSGGQYGGGGRPQKGVVRRHGGKSRGNHWWKVPRGEKGEKGKGWTRPGGGTPRLLCLGRHTKGRG